jgi:hypothetical protein
MLLQWVTIARRIVGIICLIIGIAGFVLPILPGWPFIIPAILLLGRRDPWLRKLHLLMRHQLRGLRRSRHAVLRGLGLRLSTEYLRSKRVLNDALHSTERVLRLR